MEQAAPWTLDQLVELVASVLSEDYEGAPNGRVRGVPDRRAVRWYTTVGLVDRPSAMRGRTALYGERQLLQLVAVKRRQAAGRSLAEIQRELTGATDAALRAVARVPAGRAADAPATRADEPAPRPRFWTAAVPAPAPAPAPASATVPAPAPAGAPASVAPQTPAARDPAPADPVPVADDVPAGGAVAAVHGIALPGGATLLLPAGASPPDAEDLAAVAAAARPLVALLAQRGLIPTEHPGGAR